MKDLVSIIVVTYNSQDYIKSCIDSLLSSSYSKKEIIIIDNNSSDGTRQILRSYGKKINVVLSSQNLGYAEGNNLGIKNSKGQYLFIINPDAEVEAGFLQPLLRTMEQFPDAAVCQPAVFLANDHKTLNLTGKETHYLGFDWIKDYQKKSMPASGEVYSFSGCGVLLRKNIIEKTKGFDNLYFMYYEDSDLSWRLRLMGYKMYFVPESHLFHDYKYIPQKGYQTMKRKLFQNERNRLITLIKNYSLRTLILILPIFLFTEMGMLFYAIVTGWGKEKLQTYISILRNLNIILKEREFIQTKRIITDRQIVKVFTSNITFSMFSNPVVKRFLNPVLSIYWNMVKSLIG